LITPALVLDDSCVSICDLSRHAMGRVKDLISIPNLRTLLTKEGFPNVKLTFLGGMWAAIYDFVSDERVIWVDIEGVPLNVWSRETQIIYWRSLKLFLKEKYTWLVRKSYLHGPQSFFDHKEYEYISDDESLHGAKNMSVGSQHGEDDLVDDSDVESVSETFFGDKHPSPNNSVCNNSEKVVEQQSEYPFYIYDMLNKKRKCVAQDSDLSLSHPPGFTPEVSRQKNDHRGVDLNTETDKVNSPLVHTKVMNNSHEVHENVTSNGEFAFNYSHNAHNGGLILEVLDDMIRVGQSMGYAMEGCMKNIEHIIRTQRFDVVPK
nr:RNA-directed DNA polymerase, eukaryota [Tanacetum cinerariifolium]